MKKGSKVFLQIMNMGLKRKTPAMIELIKAMDYTSDDVELWLVGGGIYAHMITRVIDNSKSKERIRFLGFQKNIYKFLRQADAFCFITGLETFGNPVIEAMHFNLPIIASNRDSMPEIFREHPESLVENKAEAIAEKINEVSKKLPYKVDYSKTLARYSWDKSIKTYIKMFEED